MISNDKRLELYTESMKELSKNHFDEFMRIFNGKMIANGFLDDICTKDVTEKSE